MRATSQYPASPGFSNATTSKAAALSMRAHAGNLRDKVEAFMSQPGGATCDEVHEALDMRHGTASARIRELVLLGRVKDSGKRRVSTAGKSVIVWVRVFA